MRECICVVGRVSSFGPFSGPDKETGEVKFADGRRVRKVFSGGREVRIDYDEADEIGEPTRLVLAERAGVLEVGALVQVAVRCRTTVGSGYVNFQGLAVDRVDEGAVSVFTNGHDVESASSVVS